MGNLPISRTITLDETSPVPSALLNELQDQIVTLNHLGRDATWREAVLTPFASTAFTAPTNVNPVGWVCNGASGSLYYHLPIRVGERFEGVAFELFGAGGAISFSVYPADVPTISVGATGATPYVQSITPANGVWSIFEYTTASTPPFVPWTVNPPSPYDIGVAHLLTSVVGTKVGSVRALISRPIP